MLPDACNARRRLTKRAKVEEVGEHAPELMLVPYKLGIEVDVVGRDDLQARNGGRVKGAVGVGGAVVPRTACANFRGDRKGLTSKAQAAVVTTQRLT